MKRGEEKWLVHVENGFHYLTLLTYLFYELHQKEKVP